MSNKLDTHLTSLTTSKAVADIVALASIEGSSVGRILRNMITAEISRRAVASAAAAAVAAAAAAAGAVAAKALSGPSVDGR